MTTNTLKNIVEVIEAENEYEKALLNRTTNIKNFSTLGPPDLCYLTKETNKSFGKLSKVGYYHYVYGAHMSSAASLGLYITNLLKLQEHEESWFGGAKWVITKGVYAIFDALNRIDIRAEVTFPGGVKLYGVTQEEKMIPIDDTEFNGAFVSTILRAMNPERVPAVKIYKELHCKEAFKEFMTEIVKFIKVKDLGHDSRDPIAYRGNRILHYITDYLIRKRRLTVALEILNELVSLDIKYVAFIADVFSTMNRVPDAVKLIAPILLKTPHVIILLYVEAKNLFKAEKYDHAYRIAKITVQLCPDSFDAWYLLIEILFYSRNFAQALIAINLAPSQTKVASNNGILFQEGMQTTSPKANHTSDHYVSYLFEPEMSVSRLAKFKDELLSLQNYFLDENERVLKIMSELPSLQLDEQEVKLYKILVKIERELGWDKLLSIRSQYFLMENESKALKPEKNQNKGKTEDYDIYDDRALNLTEPSTNFIPGISMNEQSFYAVKADGEEIVEQKLNEDFDSDESVEGNQVPSFLKSDDAYEYHQRGLVGNTQSIKAWEHERPKKITEENEPNDTEPHEELKTKKIKASEIKEPQTSAIPEFEPKTKRLCSRTTDKLFVALYEDLNTMYEWQNEENAERAVLRPNVNPNNKQEDAEEPDDKDHYVGMIWVQRGILAERTCRSRFAEKAYKKAIEKGFSLFAWTRLFKIYIEAENFKAALICLAEILTDMDNIGIQIFINLPHWIEDSLYQIISSIGINAFRAILEEIHWDDEIMNLLLKEGEYWNVEGWRSNEPFVQKLTEKLRGKVRNTGKLGEK